MIIIQIYTRTGDKNKNNQSKYVNEVFLFRIESFIVGRVAQMVERPFCMRKVRGSIPLIYNFFFNLKTNFEIDSKSSYIQNTEITSRI